MKAVLATLILSCVLLHAHTTEDLKIGHLSKSQGVDEAHPRLSWRIVGDEEGLKQNGYQVLAATRPELLEIGKADLWNSGRIQSGENAIVYNGNDLPSSSTAFWTVRTWHGEKASAWAKPARFVTARIGDQPKAPYISFKDTTPFHTDRKTLHLPPARYYRKTFTPEKKVTSAVIHASALGIYKLYVNGTWYGHHHFAPGWTNYRKRAYYNTYDITPAFRSLNPSTGNRHKDFVFGATVADGWYAGYVGYGKLVGYGGGLPIKAALLDGERRTLDGQRSLFEPA